MHTKKESSPAAKNKKNTAPLSYGLMMAWIDKMQNQVTRLKAQVRIIELLIEAVKEEIKGAK